MDTAVHFSDALTFSYAHLADHCRRKELMRLFGEDDHESDQSKLGSVVKFVRV